MHDLKMIQWKIYKEKNIASATISSEQAYRMNVSTLHSSEKLQKIWMKPICVINSVLPYEDINLAKLQRHHESLT